MRRTVPVMVMLTLAAAAGFPPTGCATRMASSSYTTKHDQPRTVSFTTDDGGTIFAHEYGAGDRAVVLAHGGRFDKESWAPQAGILAAAGFRVLAIDFRGYGESRGPSPAADRYANLHLDVLAAARYLRDRGATSVAVVGASMGGGAAAEASIHAAESEIDRIALLAPSTVEHPERIKGRKLFAVTRHDVYGDGSLRWPVIREQFRRSPEPRKLAVLPGSAHAQHIFESAQGDEMLRLLIEFLDAP